MKQKLTKIEVQAILAACDRNTLDGARDYALLRLIAAGDDSAKSWLRLKWGEVDWDYWARHLPNVYRAIMEYLTIAGRLDSIQPKHFIFVRHTWVDDCHYRANPLKHLSYSSANRRLKVYAEQAGVQTGKAQFEQLRNVWPDE